MLKTVKKVLIILKPRAYYLCRKNSSLPRVRFWSQIIIPFASTNIISSSSTLVFNFIGYKRHISLILTVNIHMNTCAVPVDVCRPTSFLQTWSDNSSYC